MIEVCNRNNGKTQIICRKLQKQPADEAVKRVISDIFISNSLQSMYKDVNNGTKTRKYVQICKGQSFY